jgi:hypothetical protein
VAVHHDLTAPAARATPALDDARLVAREHGL